MTLKKGDKRGTFLNRLAARQAAMRARVTGSSELLGVRERDQCPVCWSVHIKVPDSCFAAWSREPNGSILDLEFRKYVKSNPLGLTIKD